MFYVNTDTKLFIAAPQSDSCVPHPHYGCGCTEQSDKPVFLSTCNKGGSSCGKINKPIINNHETNTLLFTFLDNQDLPYDLTDCTLALAVDNTFSHSDSLIALADGNVLSPLDGIVEFKVNRFSGKFTKLFNAKVPASQIWMEITAYKKSGEHDILLQDRGIKLATKLQLNQGLTQDNLLNFYNKHQINAFLMDLGRYQLIPGKVIVTQSSNSNLQSGSLYIDRFNKDFYLDVSDSLVYLGNLDKSDYYTKSQVQQIAAALSDSIEGLKQALDNYYDKTYINGLERKLSDSISALRQDLHNNYYIKSQIDSKVGALSNSIAGVKSYFDNYYNTQRIDQLLSVKASNSYVTQINQQVQDLKQLHIVQRGTTQQGFAATYQLKDHNNNTLGVPINIIKDKFLSDVKLIVASQQDHQADSNVIIGDPYLKFTFNTQPASTVFVSVKDLVDTYNAGQGIKLQNNTFSIESDQQADSVKFLQIGQNTIGLKGITAAVDKAYSDAKGYTDIKLQSYYNKEQINGLVQNISNSLAAVKGTFSSYYTKAQIDAAIESISNSVDLSGYYTKSEVDAIVSELSNSIDLSNYYTKSEVDAAIAGISNSADLSDYYTKAQVDALVAGLSNSTDLNNYYNKSQIDNRFSSYYTSSIIDGIVSSLSDSIQAVKNTFSSYYNKSEVNSFIQSLSNSIAAVKGTFSSYYTTDQVNDIISAVGEVATQAYNKALDAEGSLTNIYVKSEVDSKVSALSNSIASVKSFLSSYYTVEALDRKLSDSYYNKDQINGFIVQLSNSLSALRQDLHNNYYTRTVLDPVISSLSDSISALRQDLHNNYYDKDAVDKILSDSYYTKSQIKDFLGSLSNSLSVIKAAFSQYYRIEDLDGKLSDSYYNKEQINGFIGTLSDSISALRQDLHNNYYTIEVLDPVLERLSDSISALKQHLQQNYYDKGTVDNTLSNSYYNKEQIERFLGVHSDSLSSLDYGILQRLAEKMAARPGGIEFEPYDSSNGGVIDFHFAGSSADFTSRIIENSSGALTLYAENGVIMQEKVSGNWHSSTLGYRIGMIILYANNTGFIPPGFLTCNGAAVSRSDYPDLYTRIGTSFGSGDGSTTFNLPDLTTGNSALKYIIKW